MGKTTYSIILCKPKEPTNILKFYILKEICHKCSMNLTELLSLICGLLLSCI